jgi:signal transduction histidine kinase
MQNISNLFIRFLKRRYLFIVFFVLLIIVFSYAFEYFLVQSIEGDQTKILNEKKETITSDIQKRFDGYQNRIASLAVKIANDNNFQKATVNAEREILFNRLKNFSTSGSTCEVYDTTGYLLAWSDGFGSSVTIDPLPINSISFIREGIINTWLVVTEPLFVDSIFVGTIVVKKLFEVNYPLNNRYINTELFKGTFNKETGYQLSFDFSNGRKTEPDADIIKVPLIGINKNVLGYALAELPTVSVIIDEIKQYVSYIRNFLFVFFSILIGAFMIKFIHEKIMVVFRPLLKLLVLWLVRYFWLFINFPSGFISSSVFSPSYFASPFGFGIVSSIGEMLITSLFLAVSVYVLVADLYKNYQKYKEDLSKPFILTALFGLASPPIFILLLRSYLAIIISTINDSTIDYVDPVNILPSFELLVMLFNLLLISVSFVVLSVLLICATYILFKNLFNITPRILLVVALYTIVSLLYGEFNINPLSNNIERILIFLIIFVIVLVLFNKLSTQNSKLVFKFLMYVVPISILLLTTILSVKHTDKTLEKLERYATELSRPIDTWLAYLVDETLNQVSAGHAVSLIMEGSEIKQLAFTEWATSILSREEVSSSLTIIDSTGNSLSSFQIGPLQTDKSVNSDNKISRGRTVHVREELNGFKYYSGYTPLFTADSVLVGGVEIDVATSREGLLKGESSEILKTSLRGDFKSYYKNIYYSEFINSRRIYTTNNQFSQKYTIPDTVLSYFRNSNRQTFSLEENIDGKDYATVFVRLLDEPGNLITLNAETMGIQWTVFNILKLSLYIVLMILIVLLISMLFSSSRIKFLLNYRTRILVAFLVVSIIPIGITAYFNHEFALNRTQKLIKNSLEEDTKLTSHYIENDHNISDSLCRQVAAATGIDLNIFIDSKLSASSRPELFDAEVVDRRLSAEAYRNIFLLGKNFFVESQSLGKLAYLIGYRALYNSYGDVDGVIAIPTLFKQSSVDDELQERNAYYFGAYSIVVVLALLLGVFFANQISKPVSQLTEAARRIGEGDLDYRIKSGRTDEFGKLEDAFNEMSKEIKQKREDLIKYEKELAWKEMAKQVAHEIKNPLTPIKLAVQHLFQAHKDRVHNFGEILKQSVTMIHEQIEALSRIASEFSNFARMPERRPIVCNLSEILKEAVQLFSKYEKVEFILDLKDNEVNIYADKEELRRAFINIIRNSVQAMDEKGTVSISTKIIDNKIQIEIGDNGPSMPEEIKDRIFEPNFSTKTDGMGLGLAIVKKTIDDLGGTITFTSQKGLGTAFTITLPTA